MVTSTRLATESSLDAGSPEEKILDSPQTSHYVPQHLSLVRAILLTGCCTLSLMVTSIAISSVTIGLSATGSELGIAEDQLQWLVSAHALSSGCLLIPFGRLADVYGRRFIFVVGCVVQGAFSLGCGFANDLTTLAILRGIQGLGAAATVPAALGILANAFPPGPARSVAFATFSAGQPMGGAVGFLIGGTLTEFAATTWRTMYWFVAGLSALCVLVAYMAVDRDDPSTEEDKRVDWVGAFLITAGLVLVVYVLSGGEVAPKRWGSPYIIALLVIGVILVGLFLLWQWYLERPDVRATYSKWTPPPLMKLSLWKRGNGKFAAMQLVIFCLMSGFSTWIVWVVLYYQNYKFYNAIMTMIRMIPMFPSGVICNIVIAMLVAHIDGVILIAFGCLCTGLAGLLLAVMDPTAQYWAFGFPSAVITVIGADFVFAGGALFVAKVALPYEQSLAGGLFQTMAMLGQAFGLAISTAVFNSVRASESAKFGVIVDRHGQNAPRPAQLKAYRATSWTIAGFAFFAAILAVVFLRGVGVLGAKSSPRKNESESEGLRIPTLSDSGEEKS